MRMATRRSLVPLVSAVMITLLLGASLVSFTGCGTVPTARREAKMLYDGTEGPSGSYRKIVAALPFENQVPWAPASLGDDFMPQVKNAVESESRGVSVLLPGDTAFPAALNSPPYLATGDLDSYELAAAARDAGANMVLSAKLAGIRHETEDRGMFWFAKVVHVARIQIQVTLYHAGSGARLMDRGVFYAIDISEAAGSSIDAGELPDELQFSEALADIAKTFGKLTADILKHIPWEGYISRVAGEQVTLSAGEESGLKKGRRLAVYNTLETTGDEGLQRFYAPGTQIGTITITAVHPDHCDAVADEGGPFQPGNVVKDR